MDIVELRTPTAILRHGRGRLVVLRPGTEGEAVLDVPISDLLKARLNRRADDAVVIEIYLRDPAPLLVGVPADRTPLPVLIAEHDVPAATEIVAQLNTQILAARRVEIEQPDLEPPAPTWGRTGPARADVDTATQRMTPRRGASQAIAALQRYVTPEEYLLETAVVSARVPDAGQGLIAATTTRLLFIALDLRVAHELPVPAVLWARTGADRDSDLRTVLSVHDGFLTLEFVAGERADLERMARAVNFAVRLEAAHGAIAPPDPGVSTLYAEWELLVERHSLGMVDESQFQRFGRGILRSLPDRC